MALFGERPSASPRLPSPWQAALAVSSPAISVISRNDLDPDVSPGSRTSRTHSRQPSGPLNALRTPSQLSLSTVYGDPDEPIDDAKLAGSMTSSLASSSACRRLWSSGVSEDLIISPTPGYNPSTSASTSVSSSLLADPAAHVRQGVSGGLAGHGYEGVKLIAERDKVGHIEYKLRLLPPNNERFERLTTQLKWRLQEGGGQAVYEIGVLDDGTLIGITDEDMDRSLQTLELMAAELGATVMVLRTITLASPPPFPKALFGYEGGVNQDEGNDGEVEVNLFANDGEGGSPRKAKKKKAPRPPKTKKKPSVFSIADIRGSDDPDECVVEGEPSPNQARNFPWRTGDAKKARRGHPSAAGSLELSAKQQKAWGLDRNGESIWDDYGDTASDIDQIPRQDAKNDSALRSSESAKYSASAAVVEPFAMGTDATPIAESWRARNMERAAHQDTTRWQRKPILTPEQREEVKQSRKARRKFKKDSGASNPNMTRNEEGYCAFFGSEDSGQDHRYSRSSDADVSAKPHASESEADDGGFQMFAFDTFPSSESVSQPLTQAALAALDGEVPHSSSAEMINRSGRNAPKDKEFDYMAQMYPGTLPSIGLPKKQVKKRRVRVKRAEARRLDLLRGDGITAEGMPLSFDFDNPASATSLMEAELNEGLSDNGDDSVAIKSVVKRLVGNDADEDEGLADAKGRSGEAVSFLSTSPTYTITPASPSAQRLFSLPLPSIDSIQHSPHTGENKYSEFESDHGPPSPSDTIIMPLDNLSLSFSHDEVCTANSPLGSPALSDNRIDERYSFHHNFPIQSSAVSKSANSQQENGNQRLSAETLPKVDLANARLCVEALIVKKMDMDDRYLDYSGFIL